MRGRLRRAAVACFSVCLLLSGCTGRPEPAPEEGAPTLTGLDFQREVPLEYAQCFQIFEYDRGVRLLSVHDGRDYLILPQEVQAPPEAGDYIVLRRPLRNIYLAATSAMSLFCALDGMDAIRLSGSRQEAWYIPEAAQAMEDGRILYAGKYSQPDYELLLSEGCGLAVESTMLLHTPEVQEKLEELGIPVLIDRSSYESHPLGRTEWIKLYGALLDREKEAQLLFDRQAEQVHLLEGLPSSGQTVAFFYVTSRGDVVVRKSSDYLARMIELAGGRYIFESLGDPDTATSGVTMTMEEFYAGAREADFLIYNAAIDEPIDTVEQLLDKSPLFADFRAVQKGNVWCTGKYLYQASDVLGGMIADLHTMLTGGEGEMTFIHRAF